MNSFEQKIADAPPSSLGATAAFPVPTPSIDPTFAAGKKGPVGIAPRTNYTRVNTGTPPVPDAGATEQKSLPPRGAEMLPKRASANEDRMSGSISSQPTLQNLVKQAMVNAASKVSITKEAERQEQKLAGNDVAKTASSKEPATAAAADEVEKLAGALDFLAGELRKEASDGKHRLGGPYSLTEHLQEGPPGVSEALSAPSLPDHKGQGVNIVPMHPSMQKDLKAEHGKTQMENTEDHAPQFHQHMMEKNYGKTASPVALIRAKLAAKDDAEQKETEGLNIAKKGLETAEKAHKSEPENKEASPVDALITRVKAAAAKVAEDAINPAQISAGKAVPPETSAAGQPGGKPVGGAPQGPTQLVGSSNAARDYTRGQAYANRKDDLRKYFNEPALSAAHDSTLQVALKNTSKAGPKIAAAESVKTSAARVLLSKLASAAKLDLEQKRDATAQGA